MPPVSKLAKLPAELREQLHRLFVDRAFGDIEGITADFNLLMKEAGIAVTIGKSAIGVESQRVRRAQEAIKATTEAARLIAETSPDIGDKRSAGAMAIVQSEVFDLLLKMQADEEVTDEERMGRMSEAALLLSRLSRSRVYQSRWDQEVESKAKAAAAAVAKIAKAGGLTKAQQAEIRASILGIVRRDGTPTERAATP